MRNIEPVLEPWCRVAEQQQAEAKKSLSSGVVVFGCGQLGQRVLSILTQNGIEPACLSDNNSNSWGSIVGSRPVLEPAEAVRRYGKSHTFVVAIWNPAVKSALASVTLQLLELGCRSVLSFVPYLRLFSHEALPYYLWSNTAEIWSALPEIEAALALFGDERSRTEFLGHLEFRLTADPRCLPPLEAGTQYFPPFLAANSSDVFVDCGAYDGDSIRDFVAWSAGKFRKIIAFEPDPVCRTMLLRQLQTICAMDRCQVRPEVVWSETGIIHFNATGQAAAAVSVNESGIALHAIALDDVKLENPTFLKFDIEGAETAALLGARQTITTWQPTIAVCVYHRPSDLWRIPLLLSDLCPNSELRLRSHRADGLDSVCYAVPSERKISD